MPRTRAFEVCGGPRRDTSENIVEDTCDMEENVFYGTRASVWGGGLHVTNHISHLRESIL